MVSYAPLPVQVYRKQLCCGLSVEQHWRKLDRMVFARYVYNMMMMIKLVWFQYVQCAI